jgi:DNA-binding CsgD family transcriptional regulator
MGRSSVQASTLRAGLRLVGELSEFVDSPHDFLAHIVRGFYELVGADGACIAQVPPYRPGQPQEASHVIVHGFGSETDRDISVRRLRVESTCDPAIARIELARSEFPDVRSFRRCDLVTDGVWYRSPYVEEMIAALGVDDALYTAVPAGVPGESVGTLLWRVRGGRRFDEAQRELLRDIQRAALPAYRRATRPPSNEAARKAGLLAPRLRTTLRGLLGGLSEKELARHLGLSRHTVHDYVRDVYKHFDVGSRGQLLALFLPPGALDAGA